MAALDWILDHSICKYREKKVFLKSITEYKRKNYADKLFPEMFKAVDEFPKLAMFYSWAKKMTDVFAV